MVSSSSNGFVMPPTMILSPCGPNFVTNLDLLNFYPLNYFGTYPSTYKSGAIIFMEFQASFQLEYLNITLSTTYYTDWHTYVGSLSRNR